MTSVTTVATERPGPRVLARAEHPISRRDISTEALKVLYRLERSGYIAYLVGGSVRDLMLGRTPKDFDLATNARPREIRNLFRNSRTIGRRFRLVHVFFRETIVEVATFRASPEPPEGPDDWEEAEQEAIEADTEVAETAPLPEEPESWGTPEEDARRRDFTASPACCPCCGPNWRGGPGRCAARPGPIRIRLESWRVSSALDPAERTACLQLLSLSNSDPGHGRPGPRGDRVPGGAARATPGPRTLSASLLALALPALAVASPWAPPPLELRPAARDAPALGQNPGGAGTRELRRNSRGALLDLDPEFLHDLRVATRRARTALRLFAPLLDPERAAHWSGELAWIGSSVGPVRDWTCSSSCCPGSWSAATRRPKAASGF